MAHKPLILAVIPARGGSKGVPRKNIKPLCGKPLLSYMLKAAQGSALLTRTVVSSEDDEILRVAAQLGGEHAALRRPAQFATDTAPDIPMLQHAIETAEKEDGVRYDYVAMLHATCPITTTEDIDGTIRMLLERPEADSAVSVYQVNEFHPIKMKRLVDGILRPYVDGLDERSTARRQDFEPVYKRNVAIYVSKRDVMMRDGRVWGDTCLGYVMPEERSVDINTMNDFLLAEAIVKEKQL